MKLRIKGNSVRLRLSKTDVSIICNKGLLKDKTSFGKNIFIYTLESAKDAENLSAVFSDSKMTIYIPEIFLKDWEKNDVIGFDNGVKRGSDELFILVEKDFQCIDETEEDQSDNFENPSKAC